MLEYKEVDTKFLDCTVGGIAITCSCIESIWAHSDVFHYWIFIPSPILPTDQLAQNCFVSLFVKLNTSD